MRATLCIAGGEGRLAAAVVAAVAESECEAVILEGAGDPRLRDAGALIDLGLSPRDYPRGEALVRAEGERAASLAGRTPQGARVVRGSVLGAAVEARSLLQRAQAAAENAYRESPGGLVVLRAGLVLGACGLAGGFRRFLERSPVVPLPGVSGAKLEPLLLEDFARYCVEAATAKGPLDRIYDLGCGEILTGGLLARGISENLGLRRWIVPAPGFLRALVAPLLADEDFPSRAVRPALECLARGSLPRRMGAWDAFPVRPVELRVALARTAGMVLPLRKEGEGRFAAWRRPEKKGILWRKAEDRRRHRGR